MPNDVENRFWTKVDKRADCWVWTASVTRGGYGRFKIGGKTRAAHRWLYQRLNGDLPPELQLDHLCRNRACVRPEHLEPVTGKENLRRGETIAALNGSKTHCKRGHEFTTENTIRKGDSWRACRECNRIAAREYQRKKHGYQPRSLHRVGIQH